MSDLLKGLKIDTWFKAVFAFSSAVFVVALFRKTEWLSNRQTLLLTGGLWLVSIAEWKMHKTMTQLKNRTDGILKMSWKQRVTDPAGIFLEILGVILLVLSALDVIGVLP